jgi:hypothetical protein
MASPYWIRALINKTFSGRFFFSKLTHFPIIGRLVDYALFEGDDIFYLPKDRTRTPQSQRDEAQRRHEVKLQR